MTQIHGARVRGSDRAVLDPDGIPIGESGSTVRGSSVASDGTDFLVTWSRWMSSAFDVVGARVSSDGALLDASGFKLVTATGDQTYASAVFDESQGTYQAIWSDSRGGVYGNRVDPDGTLIGNLTGTLYSGVSITETLTPRIAANGDGFYVSWSRTNDIYGSRLSEAGALLDDPGVLLAQGSNGETQVDVASNGSNGYFATWVNERSGGAIYGARLDQNGDTLDPEGILISPGGTSETTPSVAYNGTHYLVVWRDGRSPAGVWGHASTPLPVRSSTQPASVFSPIAPQQVPESLPTEATGSSPGKTVARDRSTSTAVASALPVLSSTRGVPIAQKTGNQTRAELAFGGGQYLVVWHDAANSGDLYGARVSTAGVGSRHRRSPPGRRHWP